MTKTKICPQCKIKKKKIEFSIRYKDVLRSYCKACERIRKLKYDEKNKEMVRMRARQRYLKNSESEKKRARLYRENNKDKLRQYYKKNNKKRLIKQAERMKNNPKLRLKRSISACVRERLHSRLIGKNFKATFSFLPYTIDELMQHIERQFLPRMSWENYGLFGWHIDHKKADYHFDYTSTEDKEFQECWALKNLQPLWAKDNLSKNKY